MKGSGWLLAVSGEQSAASGFVCMARSGTVTEKTPRVVADGQQTITKMCTRCAMQMPHKVGAKVCILCEMEESNK
jgi:hypothetical protein